MVIVGPWWRTNVDLLTQLCIDTYFLSAMFQFANSLASRLRGPLSRFAPRHVLKRLGLAHSQAQSSQPHAVPLRKIDCIRATVSEPFLKGRGVEIGAGAYPQPVPSAVERECFDVRSREELAVLFGVSIDAVPPVYPLEEVRERFPQNADFLIAHNVLEHSANPIRQLIEWHELVKDSGVVVLSLPDCDSCPDKGRPIASLEHLVMDYALDRNGNDFESREHVYSFMVGWNDSGAFEGKSKQEFAQMAHANANAARNDLHWHAFDRELGEKLIFAAALFGNKSVCMERIAQPAGEGDCRTLGDIIFVYKLQERSLAMEPYSRQVFLDEIASIRQRMSRGVGILYDASSES